MIKGLQSDLHLTFQDYNQLAYIDVKEKFVYIYLDDELVGKSEVFTDWENEKREYVSINYEVIYLDTLTKIK